ncbi:MAG: hypothetical protein M3014_00270, partial [Chloroflexota bacterium]|nr:hypothetical protein [Chloroflexota bacterium]
AVAVPQPFFSFWGRNGGVPVFGYPVTPVIAQRGHGEQLLFVQSFERARFEWHPHEGAGVKERGSGSARRVLWPQIGPALGSGHRRDQASDRSDLKAPERANGDPGSSSPPQAAVSASSGVSSEVQLTDLGTAIFTARYGQGGS